MSEDSGRGEYFRWLGLEAARYNELYDAGKTEPEIQSDRDYKRYKIMRIKCEQELDRSDDT